MRFRIQLWEMADGKVYYVVQYSRWWSLFWSTYGGREPLMFDQRHEAKMFLFKQYNEHHGDLSAKVINKGTVYYADRTGGTGLPYPERVYQD